MTTSASPASVPTPATAAKPRPAVKPDGSPSRRLSAQEELDVLIRARYPIIYVVSWEEERVERCLRSIAEARNKRLFTWTLTQGIARAGSDSPRTKAPNNTTDPIVALDAVVEQMEPAIYLFKDFHHFTDDQRCNISVLRRLRDVACHLRDTYKSMVVVSPLLRIAPELMKDVTVLEFGLPRTDDLSELLDRIVEDVKDNPHVKINLDPEARERLLNAARGLTLREAENVFAKTLVLDGKMDGEDIGIVFSEKQQIIKKSGLLEYYETQEGFGHVAGLTNLKQWFQKRAIAFTDRATRFGLPAPKGVLLLGVQGCGKSLCAKAVSALWKQPLLRFDIGRLFSSLIGSSEENIRRAIHTAESVAPAILWIDEIDKAFAGSVDTAKNDGGTASRVFGTLLTWLSEKTSPVFVIATANDITQLPPELLRKGRLDEIFFVDLPTDEERLDAFRIHLKRRGRNPDKFDLAELVRLSEGFSGAEIEEAIVASLFDAFSQRMDLDTDTVRRTLLESVPLSKTMFEVLTRLREWSVGRARPASRTTEKAVEDVPSKIEV